MNVRSGLFRIWVVFAGLYWSSGTAVIAYTLYSGHPYRSDDLAEFISVPIGVFLCGWIVLAACGWILQGFRKTGEEI